MMYYCFSYNKVSTGFLLHFTAFLTKDLPETNSGSKGSKINLLKSITKPFTDKFVKVNDYLLFIRIDNMSIFNIK